MAQQIVRKVVSEVRKVVSSLVSNLHQLGDLEQVFNLSHVHFPDNVTIFMELVVVMPAWTSASNFSERIRHLRVLSKYKLQFRRSWAELEIIHFEHTSSWC